eukprot:TRINITY_DN63382_c0_g1_i1.p1 TRINITY_DN63382_c0_g1~~TRINITY_DN63382_c0_g1_i1.p1  ORF type:complete len:353 (-),score=72.18 TRINITY_DN63382_c0_g1_i1:224-1282(-)
MMQAQDSGGPPTKSRIGSCICGCANSEWSCPKRCCCCCCWFLSLFVFALVLWIVVSFAQVQDSGLYANVEIEAAEGVTVNAYFAKADACSSSNPCPVAMLFHEWNGLSQDMVDIANRLVKEHSLATLVPDLFRGSATASGNILYNIIQVSGAKQERMDQDIDAALTWLTTQADVDASQLISGPGFCFGGSQALLLATRHNVSGTVTLYGSNIASFHDASSDTWGLLGAGDPLLGIYGETDTRPSPADVDGFREALKTRQVDFTVKSYPKVGHAFVKDHAIENPDQDGGAAKAAWEEIVAFIGNLNFARRLQKGMNTARRLHLEKEALSSMGSAPINLWRRFAGIMENQCAGE